MSLDAVAARIQSRSNRTKGGCLEWQGAKNTGGYGVIRYGGRTVGVHRIMLAHKLEMPSLLLPQLTVGWQQTYVLHSCDNPPCCEPAHLRLGSAQDNGDDTTERGRHGFNPNLPRKLSIAAVHEIRRKATTWDGLCDMMKKHKIGQLAVQSVVARKSYRHVP